MIRFQHQLLDIQDLMKIASNYKRKRSVVCHLRSFFSLQSLVQHSWNCSTIFFRDEFTYQILAHDFVKGIPYNFTSTLIPNIDTLFKRRKRCELYVVHLSNLMDKELKWTYSLEVGRGRDLMKRRRKSIWRESKIGRQIWVVNKCEKLWEEVLLWRS